MDNYNDYTETEQDEVTEVKSSDAKEDTELEKLRKKYKDMDGKIYEITTSIQEDDDNETEFDFIFRKPKIASYDRYVKTKALKTFITDNICEEQVEDLRAALEEYPAMAISLGEKLLNMLGLSKETTVKKL